MASPVVGMGAQGLDYLSHPTGGAPVHEDDQLSFSHGVVGSAHDTETPLGQRGLSVGTRQASLSTHVVAPAHHGHVWKGGILEG